MLSPETPDDLGFLTASVGDIGPTPDQLQAVLDATEQQAQIDKLQRREENRARRAVARGRYAMHPEKQAAVALYAKAVESKKDGPEQLMATMNRAQRRQFVAGARAHSKKLKCETLRDGNKLLRKLTAEADARGL